MNLELKFKYGYRRLKREKAKLIKENEQLRNEIRILEENA